MHLKHFSLFYSLIHITAAVQLPGSKMQPLCDLGCKCPEKGQILVLLDCSDRGIAKLPSSLQFETPLSLLMFQNNHLTTLRMDTFSIVDTIEELDLSMNHISRVDNFTFAPFKSLSFLRLSHNRLRGIAPGLLDGMSNLRVLELGHNSIHLLHPAAFQELSNLQELRLQDNPIFDLREDLFQFLPNLVKLDLQDTSLVALPSEIFKPTPRLQWLSLSHNGFENVPESALSQAPILESLDLSGNDFRFLVGGDFRRLSRLSLLHLNNLPRLEGIGKDALAGLQRLKSFSCSYNPSLSYVDPEAFGSENSTISRTAFPEQLYLRQNNLRTLKSPLSMESLSSVNFVDLADNPWSCDCNLLWMRRLKKETQMNIICDSPDYLRGRPLNTIKASELMCFDKWALTTFILSISGMIALGLAILAASTIVCSRTRLGLYVRAKSQFSYLKVGPKMEIEAVDLEWDPSADDMYKGNNRA